MLEQCLTWYEHQPEARTTSLMLLKEIKDLAYKKDVRISNSQHLNFFLCKNNINEYMYMYERNNDWIK